MILLRSGGKGSLSKSVYYLMNHEAVFRTAPATPGLLNMYVAGIDNFLKIFNTVDRYTKNVENIMKHLKK